MKAIVVLILCCVCGGYCETIERTDHTVQFNASYNNDQKIKCKTTPETVFIKEGDTLTLEAFVPYPGYDTTASCSRTKKPNDFKHFDDEWKYGQNLSYMKKEDVKRHDFGNWSCHLVFKDNNVFCDVTVSEELPPRNDSQSQASQPMDITTIWCIVAGVGVVVALIIIAQAIALCYFKRKVNPRRRMDQMAKRSRLRVDQSDQVRYSAPPSRKNSKSTARAHADTDSHIYEMVGVNALYNGSHQFKIEENSNTTERAIKDRPPLPLPHEIPEPVPPIETLPRRKKSPMQSMASTLSLNSISSSSTLTGKKKGKEPPGLSAKKAPARPPKPAEDMPGALKRPPKTTPATAKMGSIPKMHANDPAMAELKNAMRLRNIGNNSPSSAKSTLERPPVQAKPNKKQIKQEQQAENSTPLKPPLGGINPLAPTNQPIKLILPKIEASLKQNIARQKPIQDSVKSPPVKTKMSDINPTTKESHTPPQHNLHVGTNMTPVSPSIINRPLPTPNAPMASHMTPTIPQDTMLQVSQKRALPTPAPVSHMTPGSHHPIPQASVLQVSQNRSLPPQALVSLATPASQVNPIPQASQLSQNRALPPPATTSLMAPMSHMNTSQVAPSVNRPLAHEVPVTSRPLPPDPQTAIYHAPEEDFMEDDDDDEEWTYEELGKYNIYNI